MHHRSILPSNVSISFVDEQFLEDETSFPWWLLFLAACTLLCPALVTDSHTLGENISQKETEWRT